ncbi:MAG: hypothetical protein A2014_12135 [Spirochaetes bacterium GWF1_49_6]|nr:MAG: hypothetical protein A2014_12135 [Spirochaetes bacterium GWF1_49_6]
MRTFLSVILLSFCSTALFGAIVILKDGTVLNGKIVSSSPSNVIFQSQVGEIVIGSDKISSLVTDETNASDIKEIKYLQLKSQTEGLIRNKKFFSKEEILTMQQVTISLTEIDRNSFYQTFEMRSWFTYSVYNLLPIFSIGSWVMGKWEIALVSGGGSLLFTALCIVDLQNSTGLVPVFATLALGSYAFNLFFPLFYQLGYNENLKTALCIYPDRIDPSLKSQSCFPKLGPDGLPLANSGNLIEIPVLSFAF